MQDISPTATHQLKEKCAIDIRMRMAYNKNQGRMTSGSCHICKNSFEFPTKFINRPGRNTPKYCSTECAAIGKTHELHHFSCTHCSSDITKRDVDVAKATSRGYKNWFCNSSCAAKFNNKNKTKGTRRSKLEVYCTSRIATDFSHININDPNTHINGWELDIYLPDLKIAIEIQRIFHREPIFGQDKLERTIANDKAKAQMCLDSGIKLYAIDDNNKRFTEKLAKEFFDKNILPLLS